MHLVWATATMDTSGTPTYVTTMMAALSRLDPTIRHSVVTKANGTVGVGLGARSRLDDVARPDVLLVQHSSVAKWVVDAWPDVPRVFHHHGGPLTPDHAPRGIVWTDLWSINHQCTEQMRRETWTQGIATMRDAVDLGVWTPTTPLRETTPRVLFLSNYKAWRNVQRLEAACARLGLPLTCVGSPYGRVTNGPALASVMNQHDLVVTWGRGVLEAAACARCVISYDQELGDGYLTLPRFLDSRERNFSGYECRYAMGVAELCDALAQYRPDDGARLREVVGAEHDADREAQRILSRLQSHVL